MPMQTDALAMRYARGLFDLAGDAGGPDKMQEVAEELEQICDLARRDTVFREFLGSPLVDPTRRESSLRQILNNRVTDLTLRFILVLNRKGRLGHLEAIAAAYDQLVQDAFGRIEVDVFTPGPPRGELDDASLEQLRQRIASILGKEPVLHTYHEPKMLGGVKLRVGDQLIDGSLASRLRRLKQGIMTGSASTLRERFDRIIDAGGDS